MGKMKLALIALLAFAPAALAQSTKEGKDDSPQLGSAPTPADRKSTAETSERGSMGVTAGGQERTAIPGAGIESGEANGMAGGRTDEGPRGGTGIRESAPPGERARQRADDQLRAENAPGSFLRPADSPPDMNLDPEPIGSGAPQVLPDAEEQDFGKLYLHHEIARPDNPGAAAAQGSAGKAKPPKPVSK